MELGPALLLVGASYLCYLLGWRRLRALVGRRKGLDLDALAAFDLDALEREVPLVAAALPEEKGEAIHRIQVEVRRAHASTGARRESSIRAAQEVLAELGAATRASAAWTGLIPHLRVLQLSLFWMEWDELLARKALRRALIAHPAAPGLHLVGAHLEASVGHPDAAIDYLARALYYANGDPFYARPILRSSYIARRRPALDVRARQLMEEAAQAPGGAGSRPPSTEGEGLGIDGSEPIEEDSPSTKDGP